MSFSGEVKSELTAIKTEKSCCMLSELNALTQGCASMTLHGHGEFSISYATENPSVAKRIFILLKRRLEINSNPRFHKAARFGGRRVYIIQLSPADSRKLTYALHMLRKDESGEVFRGIPRHAMTRKCCQQAFLRGAFLGTGSIVTPEKDYHLEIVCGSDQKAHVIQQVLERNDLSASLMSRRSSSVLYFKRGEDIAELLSLMGAVRARMRYENILAQRSLRENVMRVTNCDHGNLRRLLTASQKQMRAIETIRNSGHFPDLPADLQAIIRLRRQNPEMTLEQLGDLMTPKLGKSGVYHRFRKVIEIAESIEAQQSEDNE